MKFILVVISWLENDHHPILQEVVKLDRIRIQSLALKVTDPSGISEILCQGMQNSLFFRHVYLKADDVAILDFTLAES
jgi:hypothetical protein